jgi:hypothetical protein
MTAKPMGSVFLGDLLRNRFVTTPPSSPPLDALITDSIDAIASSPHTTAAAPRRQSTSTQLLPAASIQPYLPPPDIDPETSLALRLIWLEAVLHGPKTASGEGDKKDLALKPGHTLIADAHDFQTRLDALVAGNDGLRQFIARCMSFSFFTLRPHSLTVQDEQHASLLTPVFALSGTLPETTGMYEDLSPAELEALLAEMESDIRAADRDMREIQELEKREVLGAGKLKGQSPRTFGCDSD